MTIYKLTDLNGNQIPISDQNLVINGDFKVWPRGDSFNTNFAYTATMWQMSSNTATVSKNPTGGMKIDISSAACILMQYLKGDYTGKTLTFQMKINGSTEYAYTYDSVQSGSSSVQLANGISLNISYSSEKQATQLWIRFDSAYISSIVIDWIDVKPLPYATVHIEEDDAISQMRCEKHVLKLPTSYSGYTGSTSYIYFVSEKLMEMASTPSVDVIPTTIRCVFEGGVTAYNISNITVNKASGEINVQVTSPPSSLASKSIGGWFDKNIILSCEP